MKHVAPRGVLGAVRADAAVVDPKVAIDGLTQAISSLTSDNKKAFGGLEKTVADLRAEVDSRKQADGMQAEKEAKINAAVDEFRGALKANDAQANTIKAEVSKLIEKMTALQIAGNNDASKGKIDARAQNEHYAPYATAFNRYFRKGDSAVGGESALRDLEVKAAMTVGSDPDGGFTVLPEIETNIDEIVKQVSPIRDLGTVRTIGTSEYRKMVNLHGTSSGWVGETDSRPQTQGPQLSELKFPINEIYAMPAASQSLLDDSFVDIGTWLAGEVALEFAQKEGAAFVGGDGVNKPMGFLGGNNIVADGSYAWGKIGYIPTGFAGGFLTTGTPPAGADCLVDTYHALNSAYRKNASWLASRSTLGAIRKLKDGQGNYLLNMMLRPEGFVEEIMGNAAVEVPDMPAIAANSFSIVFGDMKRAYLIVDRVGIRVLRDPYTVKPYVLFYTTKRVGGGVQNFEALKAVKFAVS